MAYPLPSNTPQRLGSPKVILLVAGMKANTTYHMRAKVEYDDGGASLRARIRPSPPGQFLQEFRA